MPTTKGESLKIKDIDALIERLRERTGDHEDVTESRARAWFMVSGRQLDSLTEADLAPVVEEIKHGKWKTHEA
jgi:hypothetical protein